MQVFDAIIIGSGQAGNPLAFKLAEQNLKVALIERQHVGGTCVNNGCTPTKTYVASARRMWAVRNAQALGVHLTSQPSLDLQAVKARKDNIVHQSVVGLTDSLEGDENIQLFYGEARFTGVRQVEVNGTRMEAPEIYINVGGRPRLPRDFEEGSFLTSTSILELEQIPEHLVVVGGSYIGLEFGQMFRRFGSRVTIIERKDRLVPHEDPDISESIREFLAAEGIEFKLNADCIKSSRKLAGQVIVEAECEHSDKTVTGSHLLLAVGRVPNTDSLNLSATGLGTNDRGFIEVDDFLQTAVPGIYALGDCNGKGGFTHTAYNDYEIIADHKFGTGRKRVSDRITTYALYTDPPLGRAGLSLKQAREAGHNVLLGERAMSHVARAKERGETFGKMKVLVDADTDRILGAAILGSNGDEIITGVLNIMYADQSYTTIRDSVVSHPTISELIPTLLGALKKV